MTMMALEEPVSARYDLERDGFTILKAAQPPELVRAARELIAAVVSYAGRGLEDPFQPYFLGHRADQGVLYDVVQRHGGVLWDLARQPRILDAMVPVLGEDIFVYENSVVYKPRGKRNAVPYHQDFISRPQEPRKLIAWMALDPVTRATGAMKLMPGSHAGGFLPWHRVHGETHHDRILPQALPKVQPIDAELEPGDVLIFNQLLVHGSDEVHTDSLRLALRVSYQGFDAIRVPRGVPLVVRGGGPASLATRFPGMPSAPASPPLWRRALRYVGRRLAAL